MIKYIFAILLLFSSLQGEDTISIAFVFDGPSARFTTLKNEFEKEMLDLMYPEWDLKFVDFVGDWSVESVKKEVERAFQDKQVEVVVTMGVIGSEVVTELKELPKPVIAPFVVDKKLQGLPYTKEDTSGIKNLNYLTFPTNILEDLKLFRELLPWKNLVFMSDRVSIDAFPEIFEDLLERAKELGIHLTIVPVDESVEKALEKIPPCTEALYLTPLARMTSEQIRELANGFIDRKIASFTLLSQGYVNNGILASTAADAEFERLARRVALNVQGIFLGEDPSTFSIVISKDKQLTINAKTAQDLGISLPWQVLLEANKVDENLVVRPPKLALVEAVETGLKNNPNLSSVWKEVLAGLEDVNLARARTRLQVDVSSLSRVIDYDRAVFSVGREPQSAVFGSATASQMIYSNQLLGEVRVQRFLQYARCENYQANSLDLTFEVGIAYLDVLRSQTLETIQKNNLKLTQANLQTAQKRVEVGVARLSEVYRWESQLSDNRSTVVDAYFQTASSEVVLRRLLNQSQDKPFNLVEVTMDEPYWLLKKQLLENQLKNPKELEKFTKFSVFQGFTYSPEIRELKDRVFAQAEVLGIATRAFWQPDFFLVGEMRDRFASGGAGRDIPLDGNTTDWLFGIEMNFPIYTGGQKTANQRKAYQELLRLKYLFVDLLNRIEGEIRVNINRASASYAAIDLAKKASESSQKNLDLILEGYAKGTENILDLLDAQNQALNNDLLVVNAVYDFLNDSLAVQRAMGRFDFMMSYEEQKKWKKDLEKFMQEDKHVCR